MPPVNPGYLGIRPTAAQQPMRGPTPSLAGNLDFSQLYAQGNALSGLGGDPAAAAGQLGGLYQQSYLGALGLNQQLHSGVQTGWDTLRSDVDQRYGDITQGYAELYGDVLGRISGTNQTNMTDINTAYNANAGAATQSLVSRGLGNSTTQNSIQRGIELDRQRALTNSQNQFAQLGAGYAASIGGQGLQSQMQGTQAAAGLGQAQLGALERVNVPYPDAGMYTQLASMYGAQSEAQRNRGRQEQALQQSRGNGMFAWGGGAATSGGSGGFRPPPQLNPGSLYSPQSFSNPYMVPQAQSPASFGSAYGQGAGPMDYGYGAGNDASFGDQALQGGGYDPSSDNYGAGWGAGSTGSWGEDYSGIDFIGSPYGY